MRRWNRYIFLLAIPFAAEAVLPADAGFRHKEIVDYRQRRTAEINQMHKEHENLMIYKDRQIQQEMASPPWNAAVQRSVRMKTGGVQSPHILSSGVHAYKWMFSFLALVFIGLVTWWIRFLTEPEILREKNGRKIRKHKRGMTVVEVLLAVAIIAFLAAFLIPAAARAVRSRENARAAGKLRTAVSAFEMCRSETGSWPADRTPGVVPPEMTGYFAALNIDDWWSSATELGGGWDWDNGYNFKYSVSISSPTKPADQLLDFDRIVDDGNLNTGNFRKVGSQYHYIIEK